MAHSTLCLIQTDFFQPGYLPVPRYRFSALILGDSQLQQLKDVDGARIKSLSGGTFTNIANHITTYGIDLADYRFLFVSAGTNDAQRPSQHQWERLYQPFETLILPHLNTDRITIAIVGPIRNRGIVPLCSAYSQWLADKINSYHANNIFFFDWSGRHPQNPFVSPDGGVVPRLLRDGRLHINHAGLKKLWNTVALTGPFLPLQRLALTMSSNNEPRYPHGGRNVP